MGSCPHAANGASEREASLAKTTQPGKGCIMDVLEALQNRHSVRTYTGEPVSEENLKKVVQAGLLSASGKHLCPWEFIVVRDHAMLEKLAGFRKVGAKMLAGADAAIVVLGDGDKSDVWVEDCSVVMANMHLEADSLGLGSVWVQGRVREASDGRTAEEFARELLGFPDHLHLEAVLALGMPESHPAPAELDALAWAKVHSERF